MSAQGFCLLSGIPVLFEGVEAIVLVNLIDLVVTAVAGGFDSDSVALIDVLTGLIVVAEDNVVVAFGLSPSSSETRFCSLSFSS